MNVKNCSGLVVAGLGISLLSAIPAMGAPSAQAVAPGASEAFVRGLAGDDLAAWQGLSASRKAEVRRLVDSGAAERAVANGQPSGVVSVTRSAEQTAPRKLTPVAGRVSAAGSTYEVTASYRWTWKIAGITYASIRIEYAYVTNGTSVLRDHTCTSDYTNYIPFRSIAHSESHYVSSGKGNCSTSYTIHKGNGILVDSAIYHIRVNGSTGVEAAWIS